MYGISLSMCLEDVYALHTMDQTAMLVSCPMLTASRWAGSSRWAGATPPPVRMVPARTTSFSGPRLLPPPAPLHMVQLYIVSSSLYALNENKHYTIYIF